MGIHKLTDLLKAKCPECIKEIDIKELTGTIVAVDASMVNPLCEQLWLFNTFNFLFNRQCINFWL